MKFDRGWPRLKVIPSIAESIVGVSFRMEVIYTASLYGIPRWRNIAYVFIKRW